MTANSAVAEVMRPPGSAEPTDEAPVLLELHDRRQRPLHHLGLGPRAEGLLGSANEVGVNAERHLELGHGGHLPHRLYHTQGADVLRAATPFKPDRLLPVGEAAAFFSRISCSSRRRPG